MNNLPKKLESKAKIRFQDCDPFNHLNNSKYLDYYINAREDQLLQYYNLDLFKIIREDKLGWVVSSSQISYLKPTFTMEDVVIETQLIQYSPKHLMIEGLMWNSDKTILKSFCWMGFIHFNLKTNQVESHSEKFMNLFNEVNNPLSEISFNERELRFRSRKVS